VIAVGDFANILSPDFPLTKLFGMMVAGDRVQSPMTSLFRAALSQWSVCCASTDENGGSEGLEPAASCVTGRCGVQAEETPE
jgi:hypothetical protein